MPTFDHRSVSLPITGSEDEQPLPTLYALPLSDGTRSLLGGLLADHRRKPGDAQARVMPAPKMTAYVCCTRE